LSSASHDCQGPVRAVPDRCRHRFAFGPAVGL